MKAEAKVMQQHALSYIDDVVETMGNALLGRVYDLESKHIREWDQYVDQANMQSLVIVDLTKKVDNMIIDRDGLVEVSYDDPGFTAAEAGPEAADRLGALAREREELELRPYEVRGTGWI